MHLLSFLYPALLATSSLITGADALRSGNKVKLSNVQSLTLRKDLKTSHRRVSAIPQLKCIGGSARGLYDVDIMRCKNAGADYNEEDVQWTCTASLPEEFKLGSTDVICEGYDSPDDPYILKGSCGVEYRLMLTEKGEKKFGRKKPWSGDEGDEKYPVTAGSKFVAAIFWLVFIGVALWIVYNWWRTWTTGGNGAGFGGGNRPGWGGGGGGGGGGWGGNDDPPPPYDWNPSNQNDFSKRNYGSTPGGWRPGFWSGAATGGAAGYAAGRAAGRNQTNSNSGWGGWNNGGGSGWNNGGEGSSRSSSNSSNYSSTRHESTGFGSSSRR
ncbi:transmembrane protein 66 precursor [Dendryphion nanum]|uniref:Store-operated calcium entry-associated regulatory factor n=1 Tax=Dendryphion nanum TaxID=256645 RepID=A0A9P9IJ34_9PLEO|nr:transmembrane protein 66 precursor [Dendryphion nanum]